MEDQKAIEVSWPLGPGEHPLDALVWLERELSAIDRIITDELADLNERDEPTSVRADDADRN